MSDRLEFPGEAQYVVSTHLVLARTLAGPLEHKYRGQVLPPCDPNQIRMLLAADMIRPITPTEET